MIGRRRSPDVGSLWELLGLGPVGETEWMRDGLCAQTDPDGFFPEPGESVRAAKVVCSRCPVLAECRSYSLRHRERFGVWGGLSEAERRALRRAAAPVAAVEGEAA